MHIPICYGISKIFLGHIVIPVETIARFHTSSPGTPQETLKIKSMGNPNSESLTIQLWKQWLQMLPSGYD